MIEFNINKNRLKKVVPTWKVILMWFFIINLSIFTALIHYFSYNIIYGEIAYATLIIALLSRKSYRYVTCVSFDNKKGMCIVSYYQFHFFKFRKEIRYMQLNYKYEKMQFTRLEFAITLRIKDGDNMIADIREKYNMGYTNEEIAEIANKIKQIKGI